METPLPTINPQLTCKHCRILLNGVGNGLQVGETDGVGLRGTARGHRSDAR